MLTIIKQWLKALVEIILLLPILIIIHVKIPFVPSLYAWIGSLALLYLLGIVYITLFGIRKRGWTMLASIIVSVLVIGLLWGLAVPEIITVLLGAVAFYRGHALGVYRWPEVLPISIYWLGLLVYFISSILFKRLLSFEEYMPLILGFGFVSLFITLWMTNLFGLQSNSYSDQNTSALTSSILRHNRVAVTILLVITLIITFFKVIQSFLMMIIHSVVSGIAYLLSLQGGGEPPDWSLDDQPPQSEFLAPPDSDPAWWWIILDIIGYTIAIVVCVLLLYFGVRTLIRVISAGIKAFIQFLQNRGLSSRQPETGYVDEKQQLISLKDLGQLYRDRLQQWLADKLRQEPKWKDLKSNRERVRYLYRHWLLHRIAAGFHFKASMTPQEAGQLAVEKFGVNRSGKAGNRYSRDGDGRAGDSGDGNSRDANSRIANEQLEVQKLIELYQQARYGISDIADEDVARMRKHIEERRS